MAIARIMAKAAVQSPTGRLRQKELRLAGSTRPTNRDSLAPQGSAEGIE